MNLVTLAKRYLQIEEHKQLEPMMDSNDWNAYTNEQQEIRETLFNNGIKSYTEIVELSTKKVANMNDQQIAITFLFSTESDNEKAEQEYVNYFKDASVQIGDKEIKVWKMEFNVDEFYVSGWAQMTNGDMIKYEQNKDNMVLINDYKYVFSDEEFVLDQLMELYKQSIYSQLKI